MKRYNLEIISFGPYRDASAIECATGRYVSYVDAAAIEQERDAAIARAERAEAAHVEAVELMKSWYGWHAESGCGLSVDHMRKTLDQYIAKHKEAGK